MPEYGRMLGTGHGHLSAHGRHLHPLLWFLQDQDRAARRYSTRMNRRRVAESIQAMGLSHAVLTSVNRDEQPDGGAWVFAESIYWIRQLAPGCTIEVLIPDFKGDLAALQIVMDARPEILNHNTETVPRLYRTVRPQAKYMRSHGTAAAGQTHGPRSADQVGHHGRAGRNVGRNPAGDG